MSDSTGSAKAQEDAIVAEKKGGTTSRRQKQVPDASLNMDELRELAALVIENGFTDFEFENENIRVRLSKMNPQIMQAAQPVMPMPPAQTQVSQTATSGDVSIEIPGEVDSDLYKIISPIVGTFYRSPGPDKEPYVNEGSKVTPESTVCIVEAMKLMNEIQAEVAGEIVKIYVENGQPVEFGQPLFGVRK
jgi:acetyl-CoA carboxylase biotin carboxyl carrier protein